MVSKYQYKDLDLFMIYMALIFNNTDYKSILEEIKAKKDPYINFLFLQVKDSNTAAKSLYTKLGFKNIHKFNNLSGETFINMILRV